MQRSGKLLATNDPLIFKLLEDENFRVESNGKIYTVITRTGKKSVNNVWRQVGTYTKGNYYIVSYYGKDIKVNRIIYAKYGTLKLAQDLVVNHIDGNPLNDDISNLELISQSENNYHAFRTGRAPVIGNSKINYEIAEEIRKLKTQGYTLRKLCEEFGLAKSTVSYIVNNKIWNKVN